MLLNLRITDLIKARGASTSAESVSLLRPEILQGLPCSSKAELHEKELAVRDTASFDTLVIISYFLLKLLTMHLQ